MYTWNWTDYCQETFSQIVLCIKYDNSEPQLCFKYANYEPSDIKFPEVGLYWFFILISSCGLLPRMTPVGTNLKSVIFCFWSVLWSGYLGSKYRWVGTILHILVYGTIWGDLMLVLWKSDYLTMNPSSIELFFLGDFIHLIAHYRST